MNPQKLHRILTDRKYLLGLLCLLFSSFLAAQPVANFITTTPQSGCAPLTVKFQDLSTGNPTSNDWDLGNGSIANNKSDPETIYLTPGTYTVTLTVTNVNGSGTVTKTNYITVYDKPNPNFSVSNLNGCAPLSTTFTDLSTTPSGTTITKWDWDFGDGDTSNVKNPTHTYNGGLFDISLTVKNSGGCSSTISRSQYVFVSPALIADFNISKSIKCKPPETIFFTNTTTGTGIITYLWDYGDGNTAPGKNPPHNFISGDTFVIKLTATNQIGCSDEHTDTLILNNSTPVISGPDSVCLNSPASFTNLSNPLPINSQWDFGDNTFSSQSSPTKSWTAAGIYTLKLVNTYATCTDSATKKITVLSLPVVKFTADDTGSCKVPFTVNFTDLTPGSVNWFWDFGDTTTNGSTNPAQHTYNSYPTTGTRDVTLTVTDLYGCVNSGTNSGFIKIFKPTATINTGDGGGCLPYIFKPTAAITSADGVASYLWSFPSGNPASSTDAAPVVTYNTLGTFDVSLTITTNDGCQETVTVTEAVKTGTSPSVDFTLSPATGVCAGSLFNFTDISVPADQWLWSFGDGASSTAQNTTHEYNDTGRFTVKLLAWNNGCKDSIIKSNIITVFPAVARFNPVYNCNNKKEVIFEDSSILPQTWLWDFGDGSSTSTSPSPTHQFAAVQDYTVSLTVTNGSCSHTTTQTIKIIDEKPDFNLLKDSVCKSLQASFTAININPDNVQSYIWDFGDGQSDTTTTDNVSHIYNSAGTFTVQLSVIDIRGCIETVTKANIVKIFSPKANFSSNVIADCATNTITFNDLSTTANGQNNIATWQWNFGDGQSITLNAPSSPDTTHSYANAGNYVPSLLITDSAGCQDSIMAATSIFITKPKAIFNTLVTKTCNNDPLVFENYSTGYNLNYLWDFGDSTFSTDIRPTKRYSANGVYDVKLTVTDINGCTNSYTYVNYIDVKEVIAAFTLSDTFGSCIPFRVAKFINNSINQTSNVWAYGDGFFTATPSPTNHSYNSSDTFLVKLTARRGNTCSSTATKEIIVNAPTASISYAPLNGCAPLNVNFTISTRSELTFQWDFNDGSTFSTTDTFATHTYLFPGKNGKYVPLVLIKDSTDCIIPIFGIDTIRIFSSNVNFGADQNLLCDSGTVQFSDSTISGSAVVDYLWNFGDGNTSTLQNPSHKYNAVGQYTVSLAITTIFGCMDTLVKTNFITVAKKPSIAIDAPTDTCGPSSIILKGLLLDSDTSSLSWNWDFGNGDTSQLQNPPAQQYSNITTYPVQLIVSSGSGCSDTATSSIIIHPVPTVAAGNDTAICLNTAAQLQATGADTYTWQPAGNLSCINCSNPLAIPADDITYTVTGSTVFGCTNTSDIFIEVKKPFTLTGLNPEDSVCSGKSITLNVSGAEIYTWSPPAGLNSTTSASVIASPASGTIYQVIGSDSKNCFTDTAIIDLKVNANPTVNAGEDQVLHLGNSTPLPIQYSTDVVSWLWSPATGLSCSDCPAPLASPETNTTYSITVTNGSKCTATDDVFIKVVCNNSNLFLPTAFTPNNDGLNDVFYPMGVGLFKIQSLRIFNRYGQVVFFTTNVNANDRSTGWDGRFKGKLADPGAYIYTLEVICKNNEVLTINGKILLIQ